MSPSQTVQRIDGMQLHLPAVCWLVRPCWTETSSRYESPQDSSTLTLYNSHTNCCLSTPVLLWEWTRRVETTLIQTLDFTNYYWLWIFVLQRASTVEISLQTLVYQLSSTHILVWWWLGEEKWNLKEELHLKVQTSFDNYDNGYDIDMQEKLITGIHSKIFCRIFNLCTSTITYSFVKGISSRPLKLDCLVFGR